MTSLPEKVLISFRQIFTGQGISFVTSLLSSYLFARILGPASYGVWQTAKVFLNYGTFTTLGVPFAMRRDFITLRAEGKMEEAHRLANVAYTFNLFVNPVIALIFIIIALTGSSEISFRISLFVVGLMYITTIYSGMGELLHRGINDYKTIGVGSIIYGVGTLAVVPFVYFYGFYALLFGYFAITIARSLYFYYKRPLKYKYLVDFPVLRKMISIGFPLFLVSLTTVLFSTIDRLLIAALLDFTNVGFYSLSTFLAQPITMILTSFSIVIFTQLNEKYGSRKDEIVIERQTYIPQRLLANLLSPVVGLAVVILPAATELLLPQYREGVLAAQINIFAILFYKLASFSSSGLFTLDRHRFTATSFFIAGSFKTAGSYWALKAGFGIEAIAIFSLLAYLLYYLLMLFHINKSLGKGVRNFISRIHEGILAPIVVVMALIPYQLYHMEIFNYLGIEGKVWQLVFGVLFILFVGARFLLKGYLEARSILNKSK